MNTFQRAAGRVGPRANCLLRACLFSAVLLLAAGPPRSWAQAPPPPPTYAPQSPEQLEQLVAPIALYPDSLVAEILAACTYPEQIVEAERWLDANPGMPGQAVAQAVNGLPWDASVKALTAFPSVLGNMDRNLSWTSSLGDAYYNQPQAVMAAVQVMRQRAQAAGTLESTPQQMVATQGSDIVIEPENPDTVYVPEYNPWAVYGAPMPPWPDWYPYPGIWFGGPYLSFGAGYPIGFLGGFGWGWHRWGFDWHRRMMFFNHDRYFSRSATFYNRRNFYGGYGGYGGRGGRGGGYEGHGGFGGRNGVGAGGGFRSFNYRTGAPGGIANHFGAMPRPFNGNAQAARGYGTARGQAGVRSGAFSGFDRGGQIRGFAARGRASFGGGAARGFGGFHGGGARGGGRR